MKSKKDSKARPKKRSRPSNIPLKSKRSKKVSPKVISKKNKTKKSTGVLKDDKDSASAQIPKSPEIGPRPPANLELKFIGKAKEEKVEIVAIPKKEMEGLISFAKESRLDELFFSLKSRSDGEVNFFLQEYSKKLSKLDNSPLARAMRDSKDKVSLLSSIKAEIISSLKSDMEDLTKEMSDLRKSGDTFTLEEIELLRFPLKIKMFNATEEKKDLMLAKAVLSKVKEKVVQVKGQKAPPLKA